MTAYYNEIEPFAAQWLRNLIRAGHIADGVVDERSIEDVHPYDLQDFAQCHFFAGIGVWSHALRNAGWADDRPVWTGSCPCQPFSAAGAGAGFADERHLWPAFFHLIQECRPAAVFGEQVASKDAEPWLDLVCDDLEAMGYAFGAVPFPASGVGAPHIRDRLYWVANDSRQRLEKRKRFAGVSGQQADAIKRQTTERGSLCAAGGLADHNSDGCEQRREGCETVGHGQAFGADCGSDWLADAVRSGSLPSTHAGIHRDKKSDGARDGELERPCATSTERTSPLDGFWRDSDWLLCRDGKWRPVEPGTFPLVDWSPSRVGRLRAYGNAIVGPQAQAFIEAVMGLMP